MYTEDQKLTQQRGVTVCAWAVLGLALVARLLLHGLMPVTEFSEARYAEVPRYI